jgi:hypothetical protein
MLSTYPVPNIVKQHFSQLICGTYNVEAYPIPKPSLAGIATQARILASLSHPLSLAHTLKFPHLGLLEHYCLSQT